MTASELAFDIALIPRGHRAIRKYHIPDDIAAVPALIPNTLLVDEDRAFAETFANLARKMRVPFKTFTSAPGLETRRTWNYNLILLDEKTVGKENLLDFATKMTRIQGNASIILIGDDEPTREEMAKWSPMIKKFLYKDWDVEKLFHEALRIFAEDSKKPNNRRFVGVKMKRLSIVQKDLVNQGLHLLRIVPAILIGAILLLSTSLLAEEEVPFAFGDSCYMLTQMDEEQLMDLARYKNHDQWSQFCSVDDSEECSQYSDLFSGIGYLAAVKDQTDLCQFKRYKYRDLGPALFPNFGSYFPEENFGPYFPMENFGFRVPN